MKPRRPIEVLLLLSLAPACNLALEDRSSNVDVTAVDPAHFEHRWAIDMNKVRQRMPSYSEVSPRFVGVAPDPHIGPLGAKTCENEAIIGEDHQVSQGGCFAWGNMIFRNFDHSRHVDNPAQTPIVNIIDEEGNQIDPPGYLNIIPLLRAERHQQTEIRKNLHNGDILVYFHPEDEDSTQNRMHHAAMYYDTGTGPLLIEVGDVPFVHHIDNPTSYGPAFNSGVDATPAHVFRFSPNGAAGTQNRDDSGMYQFACNDEIRDAGGPAACQDGKATFTITDEMAQQYAYMARNWALMTNGHAPFADFHSLTWRSADQRQAAGVSFLQEVDRFAAPALSRGQIPKVYCAGLVFTNLTLGMNRPLNEKALGESLFTTFRNNTFEVDDDYMRLGEGGAREELRPEELADTMNLPRLGRMAFEPIVASDIIDYWLDRYYGGRMWRDSNGTRGLSPQERAAILGQAAPQLVDGFSQLRFQAPGKPGAQGEHSAVATVDNVKRYACTYSGRTDCAQPEGWTSNPQTMEEMKALEHKVVANRYVPPFGYDIMADREDSVLSYVGTIIPVDLLTCTGDCSDVSGGQVTSFMMGGPDTSQYPHFNVPNGGRHTQRVLAVSAGPTQVGGGSWVATRISAANIHDVRVILHPSGSFPMLESLFACDHEAGCLEGANGIPLPLDALGNTDTVWNDVSVKFNLFQARDVVRNGVGGLGCHVTEEGNRLCPGYDEVTGEMVEDAIDITHALDRDATNPRAPQWTLTVIDLGQQTTGAEVQYCDQCTTGGAHSNQWKLQLRNDPIASGNAVGMILELQNSDPSQPNYEAISLAHEAHWSSDTAHEIVVPDGAIAMLIKVTPGQGDDVDVSVTREGETMCEGQNGTDEAEECRLPYNEDQDTVGLVLEPGKYTIDLLGYECGGPMPDCQFSLSVELLDSTAAN